VETVTEHVETVNEHVETVTEHVETVNEHVETVTEHVETVTEHMETITERVETLTEHSKVLFKYIERSANYPVYALYYKTIVSNFNLFISKKKPLKICKVLHCLLILCHQMQLILKSKQNEQKTTEQQGIQFPRPGTEKSFGQHYWKCAAR
jgi:predicted O-linked N-acetylglucosamine transferase (SPINDLY family)